MKHEAHFNDATGYWEVTDMEAIPPRTYATFISTEEDAKRIAMAPVMVEILREIADRNYTHDGECEHCGSTFLSYYGICENENCTSILVRKLIAKIDGK